MEQRIRGTVALESRVVAFAVASPLARVVAEIGLGLEQRRAKREAKGESGAGDAVPSRKGGHGGQPRKNPD